MLSSGITAWERANQNETGTIFGPTMACPNCGSWTVRADRSLAGRMVCGRCETPLNGGKVLPSRFRLPWRLLALAVVVAAAALATLEPAKRKPRHLNGPAHHLPTLPPVLKRGDLSIRMVPTQGPPIPCSIS